MNQEGSPNSQRYKAHLLTLGQRPDGLEVKHLVGKFRADLRLSLMMVTARRMAAMQQAAGLPAACVRGLGVPLPGQGTIMEGGSDSVATVASV